MTEVIDDISIDFTRCFASDYEGARTKFLAKAKAAGAKLAHYKHPALNDPRGQDLYVDVARLGDVRATRQLVVISGTHGLEGLSGSAAQIGWLAQTAARCLPQDVSVLLVHALNPYGFAYGTRTTENNVDLNRNFVDHCTSHPPNPSYAELHSSLIPQDWSPSSFAASERAITEFSKSHGEDALFDALARGQYTHPEGLYYGGNAREWSNRVLETIVKDHLLEAKFVGLIDWHTGIGDWGKPFFLCFNDEGSELYAKAAQWWGRDRVLAQRPHGRTRPNYQGLVFHGMREFLGSIPMLGAVVEFGTRGPQTRRSLQLDVWLKFNGASETDGERIRLFKDDILDTYVPVSGIWREATTNEAVRITLQAIAGLAAWK